MKKEMLIGGKQLFWLVAAMQAGMTILLTINPAIAAAKQDAWLSIIVAGFLGLFMAYVHSRLSQRFPSRTFIEYVMLIVGKWIGHVIVGLYMAFWFVVLGMILRQYSEFILSTILPRTPMLVPMLGLLLTAVYAALSGIEVIARCAELFGPFVLLGILVPLVMTISGAKINNLLPFYADTGMTKILLGSLPTTAFLGDCIMLLVLYAFVREPKSGTKPALFGVGLSALLTSIATLLTIAVMGQAAGAGDTYPYFNLIRSISYFDFVQNLDSFVIAIWIVSVFIKVSLYFFVCTYGSAQWLKVRKWRRMGWAVVPIVLLIACIPRDFVDSSVIFPQRIAIPYLLPIHMLGIPLLLWAVAVIRRVGQRPAARKN
ncbi:GerAB/ArcD/ProY family transporter [Paenibacillus rhizovicinus]|uniref:GerAB/ArcD/ProY family transporter n=1 Tax=Paenibacillus rhizovicinus TaxID=2704463 RepID=A0A6C0P3V6_9BACL|nr:GerAB/ArcD/ProY family transporter [Paenibacillus rhizovicinus]QHW33198.1 GerAB/ArcD/ProY family transporter [Paenibacillus rhizovicinus]